jgi:hypothetical protein
MEDYNDPSKRSLGRFVDEKPEGEDDTMTKPDDEEDFDSLGKKAEKIWRGSGYFDRSDKDPNERDHHHHWGRSTSHEDDDPSKYGPDKGKKMRDISGRFDYIIWGEDHPFLSHWID